jgi:hypothetical protein
MQVPLDTLAHTHAHAHAHAHTPHARAQDTSYGSVEAAHRAGEDREPLSMLRLCMLNMHAFNYGCGRRPVLHVYVGLARVRGQFCVSVMQG